MRAIDSLKILFAPILPNTSEKIHQMFGYTEPLFGSLEIENRDEDGDNYEILSYKHTELEDKGVREI